jgi:hypothetical protein
MVRIEPEIGQITRYVIGAHLPVQNRDHPIWTSESRQEANMIGSRMRALKKLRPDISMWPSVYWQRPIDDKTRLGVFYGGR